MPFDRLENRIGSLPEIYHSIPVERPPVYDTSKMLQPLLSLADYLSPHKKALRQMEIAKANAEYRALMPGGRDEQMWYWKLKKLKEDESNAVISRQREDERWGRLKKTWGLEDADRARLEAARRRDDAIDSLVSDAMKPQSEDQPDRMR